MLKFYEIEAFETGVYNGTVVGSHHITAGQRRVRWIFRGCYWDPCSSRAHAGQPVTLTAIAEGRQPALGRKYMSSLLRSRSSCAAARASSNGAIGDPVAAMYRLAASTSSAGADLPLVSVIMDSSPVLPSGTNPPSGRASRMSLLPGSGSRMIRGHR